MVQSKENRGNESNLKARTPPLFHIRTNAEGMVDPARGLLSPPSASEGPKGE